MEELNALLLQMSETAARQAETISGLLERAAATEARLHCCELAIGALLNFQPRSLTRESRLAAIQAVLAMAQPSNTRAEFLRALDPDWKPSTRH